MNVMFLLAPAKLSSAVHLSWLPQNLSPVQAGGGCQHQWCSLKVLSLYSLCHTPVPLSRSCNMHKKTFHQQYRIIQILSALLRLYIL